MAVITGRVKAEPDAPEDRSEGVIYACVEEGDQFVKIGWAASVENAYARWISIQIGNPRRIKMHLIGDGSLHDEAALHGQLRQHAIRGEWFRIEGAVETVLAKARPLPPRAFGAGRPPTERTAAEQWLIRALASGPRSAGELFAAGVEAGHSQKTVRRAADALAVLRDPPGGGRRCRWMLPLGDTTGPDA
jgi:hypothetical protein